MQYIHHSPGRLRIKFSQLRNNPALARKTESALRSFDGVTRAEVSIVTGSLLVHYDVAGTTSEELLLSVHAVIQKMGLASASSSKTSLPEFIGTVAAEKLVEMAVEKCIQRSAMLLLGALL